MLKSRFISSRFSILEVVFAITYMGNVTTNDYLTIACLPLWFVDTLSPKNSFPI